MRQPLTCFLGRITLHFETVSLSRVSSHFTFIGDSVFFKLTQQIVNGDSRVYVFVTDGCACLNVADLESG